MVSYQVYDVSMLSSGLKTLLCFQVVDVAETTASFYGTKVEVKMKKSEPGSWAKLNFPRQVIKCFS